MSPTLAGSRALLDVVHAEGEAISDPLIVAHGVMHLLFWGPFIMFHLAFMVWKKNICRKPFLPGSRELKLYTALHVVMGVADVIAVGLGILYIQKNGGSSDTKSVVHRNAGWLILAFALGQEVLPHFFWSRKYRTKAIPSHKYLGYVVVLFVWAFQIWSGMYLIGWGWTAVYIVQAMLALGVTCLLALSYIAMRSKAKVAKLPVPTSVLQTTGSVPVITADAVALHTTDASMWVVVDGVILDLTEFIHVHPGGQDSIIEYAGRDASEAWHLVHDPEILVQAAPYVVGVLPDVVVPAWALNGGRQAATTNDGHSITDEMVCINARTPSNFVLQSRSPVNHNTIKLRFQLPSNKHHLGLRPGQHILVVADIDGRTVTRPYTPVAGTDETGYFELVVKVYKPQPPTFPVGGAMSQHLNALSVGDQIAVRGPVGDVHFSHPGTVSHESGLEFRPRHICMIAGGTGITPMLQILRHFAAQSPGDADVDCAVSRPQFHLVFANSTDSDVLLMSEVEAVKAHVNVHYTVSRATGESDGDWPFHVGRVDKALIERAFSSPQDSVALLCGPPGLVKHSRAILTSIGFDSDKVLCF